VRFRCIVDRARYNVYVNRLKFVKFTYHEAYIELKVVRVDLEALQ